MTWLANLSIRNKLVGILLLATVLPLAASFTVLINTELKRLRRDLLTTTEVTTRAVGNYAALALAFTDREEARRALAPVRDLDQVLTVALYDTEGHLFESYRHSGISESLPEKLDASLQQQEITELRTGVVHCFRPVIFGDETYGTIHLRASAAPLEQRVARYLAYMATLGTLLLFFATGMAYVLQSFVSGPILELAAVARRVSEDADYSVRVDKPADDEIGQLYDGFNVMLDQIEARQLDLERSNRDLDQFAHVASHDLKAPLRAISTLAGWIAEDLEPVLGDETRYQMGLLTQRVRRMDSMIDGILNYSRSGRLDTAGELVNVGEMVHELIEILAPANGLTIDLDLDLDASKVVVRRQRLEQVLLNLVSNAIKYHDQPESGTVTIRYSRHKNHVEFSVIDDGPGIDERYHERIFEMFQTLERRDEIESTGLGLALVKRLVEEEGGQINIESTVGAGALFRFTWPLVT